MRDFAVEALELIKRCHVYISLRLDDYLVLEDIIRYINISINIATDYLEKTLPKWVA